MVILQLCVNDENGNVTDTCDHIDIETFGLTTMQFECEMSFQELPDNRIQIGEHVYQHKGRQTMVGNVFWNAYHVAAVEMIRLVDHLSETGDTVNLVEAASLLYDKWHEMQDITIDDFSEAMKS